MDNDLERIRNRIVEICNEFLALANQKVNGGRENGEDRLVPDAMAGAYVYTVIKEFYPKLPEDEEAALFIELKDLVMNALFDRVSKDVDMKRLIVQIKPEKEGG